MKGNCSSLCKKTDVEGGLCLTGNQTYWGSEEEVFICNKCMKKLDKANEDKPFKDKRVEEFLKRTLDPVFFEALKETFKDMTFEEFTVISDSVDEYIEQGEEQEILEELELDLEELELLDDLI